MPFFYPTQWDLSLAQNRHSINDSSTNAEPFLGTEEPTKHKVPFLLREDSQATGKER